MSTSIEDNELPKAILTRIMKNVLPENTNIQANAKLAMTKSTTLFINYLASAANDVAASAGHKIVSGAHVLKALESIDLEEMVPRLTEEFKAFHAIQKSKKESAAKVSKEKQDSAASSESKKRKPSSDDTTSSKSRKATSDANPRDDQDTSEGHSVDGRSEDENEEVELEDANEDEQDGNEEEDEDEVMDNKDREDHSLNMDEPERDEDDKASNAGDGEDSDGF
ncbi:hypothetical protein BGX28_008740 [Mortierella sp. GBA30]|nr:hypothetical protein BGX28_008740 [Mortierella sp. GBA30]